jgi:hypothetical protein
MAQAESTMTHRPHAALNAPPGEAHINDLEGMGELGPDGYYWVTFPFKGKLDRMRRDQLVFLANMLRPPRGGDLIHVDGDPMNDAFSNLQEAVN